MNATYTGPERRWMTRSLYDWTDRSEHHDNKFAIGEARSVAILEKLRTRAVNRGRREEADALWDGLWELKQKLQKRRERIAEDATPWFDGSAFATLERNYCGACGFTESHDENCPLPERHAS